MNIFQFYDECYNLKFKLKCDDNIVMCLKWFSISEVKNNFNLFNIILLFGY